MLDKHTICKMITAWQYDAGESFTDYFSNINEASFMMWCLGRGHITKEQFNLWEKVYMGGGIARLDARDFNHYLYNDDGEHGAQFAPVITDEWTEEGQEKAFTIFGEFVSESIIYQKRLIQFFEEYYPDDFECENEEWLKYKCKIKEQTQ